MKNINVKLNLIFALVFAFSPLSSSAQETEEASLKQPQLSIEESIYNFGTVQEGTPVEHIFNIGNTGSALLEISKIYPSCGCTAAVTEDQKVPAGGTTKIKTTFDTNGFRGYKMKTVRIYTNDPKKPSAVLSLEGTIQTDIEIDPPRLHFGVAKKGSTPSLTATVHIGGSSKITIKEIAAKSDDVLLSVKDTASGKSITATLKDNMPLGIFRTNITVTTASNQNPVVLLPVFARIEGDLELAPSEVSLGLVEGPLKEAVVKTVQLKNTSSHDIKILSAASDNPAVSVETKPMDKNIFLVTTTVKSGTTGTLRAKVTITTDHPDQDQHILILPVYGIISKKGA